MDYESALSRLLGFKPESSREKHGKKRHVTRQDAEFPHLAGGYQFLDLAVKHELFRGYDLESQFFSQFSDLPSGGDCRRLLAHFVKIAHHVESLLGNIIHAARDNLAESFYGLVDGDVLSWGARELLGHVERL